MNFPAYLAAAFDLARGYSDAMSREGPGLELGAAVLVLALAAVAMLPRPGLRATLVGFALLLAFKEGFTRHDVYHAARYFAFALAALPLLLGVLPERRRRWVPRRAVLIAAALVASVSLARALRAVPDAPETWPDPLRSLSGGFQGLVRPLGLRAALEAQRSEQRAALGLTRVARALGDSPVDVLGNHQIVAQLSGMRWSPRYCFQSYAAYTDRTAARNAACLSGSDAPRFLLVDGRAIDGRYPTLEDCGSVLAALQRYRPVDGERGFLLLERVDVAPAAPDADDARGACARASRSAFPTGTRRRSRASGARRRCEACCVAPCCGPPRSRSSSASGTARPSANGSSRRSGPRASS